MDVTLAEFAGSVRPAITRDQASALAVLAGIPVTGHRRSGQRGKPPRTYSHAELFAAHAEELRRTSRPFQDTDWIAAALIGRHLVDIDTEAGTIWWRDGGERAEVLSTGNYGWVRAGRCSAPAHRLIWIAAEGEIPPAMQINHINRRRWDNRRANLEVTSPTENVRHMRGEYYLSRDEAIRQLAELGPPEDPGPWTELMRAPGGDRAAIPGHALAWQPLRPRWQ